jgi:hypothetical protein
MFALDLTKLGASLVAAGEEALAAAKAQAEQLENAFKLDGAAADGGTESFLPDGTIALSGVCCVDDGKKKAVFLG